MTSDDAQVVARAIARIQEVMDKYPDDDDTYMGVDVSTTGEEQNFFISRLEDLVEIGMPVGVRSYPQKEYPFEVYTYVCGIEIHCVCTQEDLNRCALNAGELE